MKTKITPGNLLMPTAFIAIILSVYAFSSGDNNFQRRNNPVKLLYNQAPGKAVTYTSVTDISQVMDVQGQTVNVLVNVQMGFKTKMIEKQQENIKLEVSVDSLIMAVESMQGSTDSRIREVEGKVFSMILSPLGKPVDLSDAERIEYSVEGQGNANMAQSFADVFPTLPEKEIRPGDKWNKTDTTSNRTSLANTKQILTSEYTYEGNERLNGIDCAKITSTFKGEMETNAQSMGMNIYYSGPVTGQTILYFAISEGYFLSQEVSSKMNGTIEISGPENMTFPIYMDTSTKTVAK